MNANGTRDLSQNVLNILVILLLIVATSWVIKPFAGAIVWAATVVVATWPMLIKLQGWFRGRRWAAVLVMTLALLAIFVVPLLIAIGTLIGNIDTITGWAQSLVHNGLPATPGWVGKIPLAGAKLTSWWNEIAALSPEELQGRIAPYSRSIASTAASVLGSVGSALIHLLLIVAISAILYATGEKAARAAVAFARRLGGDRGEEAVTLAGAAVRGVALGVVVTALLQSVLAAIGLVVAGVPFAGVLTALSLMACIAQLGPAPVLVPATIWLFSKGQTGWGVFLLVWTIFATLIDNVIRPLLIKKGVELPLLLIITGVIGGLAGFGIIGLFVGPVLLAVSYTLLTAWVRMDDDAVKASAEAQAAPEAPHGA